MTFSFGSVCSGIEAASVAFGPLGWKAAWLSEIDKFASAVLAHHYPQVKNLGDMTKIAKAVLLGEVEAPDALCGGTPCQAFSVAGLRQSLADDRGNLTLKYVELLDAIDHVRGMRGKPACVGFWENVPGVLSTKDNAFGCFLAGLAGEDDPLIPPGGKWSNAGAVYGPKRAIAWRTLDAQYFGLAQRRRRVFVVASARNGFDPAQVLFEWDGVRRDSSPSRETGQEAARCLTRGSAGGQRYDGETETFVTHSLRGEGFDASEDGTGRGTPLVPVAFDTTQITSAANYSNPKPGEPCHPLAAGAHPPAIAFAATDYESGAFAEVAAAGPLTTSADRSRAAPLIASAQAPAIAHVDVMPTMTCGGGHEASHNQVSGQMRDQFLVPTQAMTVRRLIPVECERLQGFPDGHTAIPWRGRPAEECPDGPRYKALGNSWAVPCARWIGERIDREIQRLNLLEAA